jgi:hypothetical protein
MLEAVLHPAQVSVRHRSPLRAQGRALQSVPVGADALGAADDEAWRPALDALDEALRRARTARGALRVVVSDHFVRYALIPWNAQLVADRERLAFARLALREVFGAGADVWAVCTDRQPAGQHSFAAAIDRTLLEALRDLAGKHRLRLRAVEPAFSVRVQRYRRSLKERSFCFASIEPGRLTLAFHGADGWQALRGRHTCEAPSEELAVALRQEAAAAGATANGTLYLAGENLSEVAPFTISGWKIVRLDEPVARGILAPGDAPALARG